MEWKTKISNFTEKEATLRGVDHNEMIGKNSFAEAIYLLLKGEMPSKEQAKLLDAIFVATIDHGIAVTSIIAARSVASGGNPLNTAVAAGVSSLGESHGGAIEACAKTLSEIKEVKEFVTSCVEKKKRIPGYGHKVFTDVDPRTEKLFSLAKELNLAGEHCERAFAIEKELAKQKGRVFCLNVDGIIAALLLDLGFDYRLGKAFFIIGRTPGICAHVHEELTEEKPVRRLDDWKYVGN